MRTKSFDDITTDLDELISCQESISLAHLTTKLERRRRIEELEEERRLREELFEF